MADDELDDDVTIIEDFKPETNKGEDEKVDDMDGAEKTKE